MDRTGNPCAPPEFTADMVGDIVRDVVEEFNRRDELMEIVGDYDLARIRELVEADREGRCVVADAPPSPGKRYVLRAMCRYCPDNYRIGPRCFQQKKCKVKVLEETRAKEEAGFSENTGGA